MRIVTLQYANGHLAICEWLIVFSQSFFRIKLVYYYVR